ncbi:MAG TPA: hypothetical protein VK749_05070 [Xanthobacteraceae bacterium]|jgi:hypothetical protein|nr:hypothetical protein [Xanthobacteraceae bacterium]
MDRLGDGDNKVGPRPDDGTLAVHGHQRDTHHASLLQKRAVDHYPDALSLDMDLESPNLVEGIIKLRAYFGRQFETLSKRTLFGTIPYKPYNLAFAFAGGLLLCDLRGMKAPLDGRLGSPSFPESMPVAGKSKSGTNQKRETEDTNSIGSKIGVKPSIESAIKAKVTAGLEVADEFECEFTFQHQTLLASGPEDKPQWTFQSADDRLPLRGWAPGRMNSKDSRPLAHVVITDKSPMLKAGFFISANDVKILNIEPHSFGRDAPVTVAVAKAALLRHMSENLKATQGRVCISAVSVPGPSS